MHVPYCQDCRRAGILLVQHELFDIANNQTCCLNLSELIGDETCGFDVILTIFLGFLGTLFHSVELLFYISDFECR